MIRINLLPQEYALAQARNEQKVIGVSVGGVFVILVTLFYFGLKNKESALKKQIDYQQERLNQQQTIVAQIDRIEQDKKTLLAKRDIIRNLNSSRLVYPVFFEDFLPLIPSDVWITDLRLEKQSGLSLDYRVSSKALSNFALATWITNLEQSTHFSNVKLDRITYELSPGQDRDAQSVLNFSISFGYQHKGPLPLSELN